MLCCICLYFSRKIFVFDHQLDFSFWHCEDMIGQPAHHLPRT